MPAEVLRLDNIVKTFTGVIALKDVSFDVRAGEVHALVGENGAGKSTLIGVAAGVIAPDSGSVTIGGQGLTHASPEEAQLLGLGVVYQHATLLDDLTVTENLTFSLPSDRRPTHAESPAWVGRQLVTVGADVRPSSRAEDLSIAERQLVEIARALALDSTVLVFDEPTESLTAAESERLFEQIERLRAAGKGIVYISHRFPEVRRIADRITVLRDGEVRGTFDAQDVTEDDVLQLIVGRKVDHVFPEKLRAESAGTYLLETAGLTGGRFSDVDVAIAAGEIVGLAGIEGNGQREFLRSLAGLHPHEGEVRVDGRAVTVRTPAEASGHRLVHLPGDRHAEGVFLPLSVRENISALVVGKLSRWTIVRPAAEQNAARDAVDSLRIRTPDIETPVASLSGGNQQKVIFARSLAADPLVLLADEPTRGVDVGARVEIYRLLRDFADAGHAVIVLSTDAIELAGLCDRVLVFSRGRVVQTLAGAELTERAITSAALTSSAERGDKGHRQRRIPHWKGLGRSDYLPGGVLALLVVLLALYTTHSNSLFLSQRSMSSMLLLTSILAFVACGQLTVLLVGSIDLSVGPLMGFVVVVMSFFATGGSGTPGLIYGIAVSLGVGALVGLANGLGVRLVRLPPVIATLVTYIFLQGLALVARPTPKGYIDASSTRLLQSKVGLLPVVAIIVIVLVVAFEWTLRRSRTGVELRAVGSDEARARRVGARVGGTVVVAHVVCSVLTACAGIVLTSLVGVGQAGLATEYTLTSIAAVVLAGASIFGGRGSFVGACIGALLIQEIVTSTSFLGLASAWQEWLPGLLILVGAALFSRARGRSSRALGIASS